MQVHRFKTDTYFKEDEIGRDVDAYKYIKHYRDGMSSLKKIKLKHHAWLQILMINYYIMWFMMTYGIYTILLVI